MELCAESEKQNGDSGRLVLSELGRNEWLIVRVKAAEFTSADRYHQLSKAIVQRKCLRIYFGGLLLTPYYQGTKVIYPRYKTGGLPWGRSILARLNVNFPRCKTGGLFLLCLLCKIDRERGHGPLHPRYVSARLRTSVLLSATPADYGIYVRYSVRSLRAYVRWLRYLTR